MGCGLGASANERALMMAMMMRGMSGGENHHQGR